MRQGKEEGNRGKAKTMDRLSSSKKTVKCPLCKKEVPFAGNPFRPFCSRGCKGLDLIHWASEDYHIEGKPEEEDKDEHGE
jgi:endogenous inhibitor of DNA gyrase (YacG/DUF329 family)